MRAELRLQISLWIAWALGPGAFAVLAILTVRSPDYWVGPTPNGCCGMLPFVGFAHLLLLERTVKVVASGGDRLLGRLLIAYFAFLGSFVAVPTIAGSLPREWLTGPGATLYQWLASTCLFGALALIPGIPLTVLLRSLLRRRRRRRGPGSALQSPP